jgi:phosphocarrier protein HPr
LPPRWKRARQRPWFDAKSIVKVMATKAPKGTVLHIRASGDGANDAVDALVETGAARFRRGADHVRTA